MIAITFLKLHLCLRFKWTRYYLRFISHTSPHFRSDKISHSHVLSSSRKKSLVGLSCACINTSVLFNSRVWKFPTVSRITNFFHFEYATVMSLHNSIVFFFFLKRNYKINKHYRRHVLITLYHSYNWMRCGCDDVFYIAHLFVI